ncbi:hypothetical protein [Flavivirga sp. 57AJ16]|nr:hypothetical protein [Flavivirga sp. 57AJ16]MDD7885758.1 hypothetical protein [Flavivirga sp. 57AJ16]
MEYAEIITAVFTVAIWLAVRALLFSKEKKNELKNELKKLSK